jgi:Xaa-Pro aminopeptidase
MASSKPARRAPTTAPGAKPPAPFDTRLKRLRQSMHAHALDSLLITAEPDIQYLTGFPGESSRLIVTQSAVSVLSDSRFTQELSALPWARVIIRSGTMAAAQAELLKDLSPKRLGVQAEQLTLAQFEELRKGLGAKRIQQVGTLIAGLRVIKDEAEVALIRKAVKLQEAALLATLPTIKAGQRETEIAARLEYECRTRGAEGMCFGSIVAAQANGSKPHYRAGPTKTKAGSTLLIDWGVRHHGYCADMTRTFALGRWPARLREAYEVVLEAQLAAIDAIKPGRPCAEADKAARDVITEAGLGPRFSHSLGHGLGLEVHEAPRLSSAATGVCFEPGMVVTVEPGVYIPGVGGIRIEDDILVTNRGAKNLCSLPKQLEWATLHG